jgi:transglutaminase-like putative cysteine protease
MKTTVTTYTIPSGDRGAYSTLRIMKRIVGESMKDIPLLDQAKDIIRSVGGKDRKAQAEVIGAWMSSRMRFVRDPYGVETIHTPLFMLERIHTNGIFEADCDDYAVLSASLAKAVGLRTKFVILGFLSKGAPWSHVYTIAETPQGWFPFDVSFGVPPGVVSRKAYYEV